MQHSFDSHNVYNSVMYRLQNSSFQIVKPRNAKSENTRDPPTLFFFLILAPDLPFEEPRVFAVATTVLKFMLRGLSCSTRTF